MPKQLNIKADIKAVWMKLPIYRIWIDDELMCERTFWLNPDEFLIQEDIFVEVDEGQHQLILESVDPNLGKVWMDKVSITDTSSNATHDVKPHDPRFDRFQKITFQA